MKLRFRVISAFFLATATLGIHAQAPFEGAIDMDLRLKDRTFPFSYLIKGHKIRMETATSTIILIDLDAHTQTILIPELKSYAQHVGDLPSQKSNGVPPVLKDQGRTETIAGHVCEVYNIESDKYSGTGCLTREFGSSPFGDALGGSADSSRGAMSALQQAGMALRMSLSFHNEKDGDPSSMVVTKIDFRSVDDSLFAVPQGWHQMNDTLPLGGDNPAHPASTSSERRPSSGLRQGFSTETGRDERVGSANLAKRQEHPCFSEES